MPPLWKQRSFLLLAIGQSCSWFGSEITGIGLPLIVLALTNSPAQAGMVTATRGLAYVVWSIPAGVVIDRWNRQLVMVAANVGSAVAMSTMAITLVLGRLTIPMLVLLAAIEGSCFVFANLGRFAVLPRVLSREQFPAGVAQFGVAENVALLGGPPLGGWVYQTFGGVVTILLDAVTYLFNAVSIFFINTPLRSDPVAVRKPVLREVGEAIHWFWQQPVLRLINLSTACRALVTIGLTLLIIVVARNDQVPALSIGAIFAAGAVGGLVGSVLAPRVYRRTSLWPIMIGVNLLTIVCLLGFNAVNTVLLLAIMMALYATLDPVYYVATGTYSAAIIPDALRGRVYSLTRLVVLGAHSLGSLLAGVLLQTYGPTVTLACFGLILTTLVLILLAGQRRHPATLPAE